MVDDQKGLEAELRRFTGTQNYHRDLEGCPRNSSRYEERSRAGQLPAQPLQVFIPVRLILASCV